MGSERIKPGPGQESVWDYPRPPRIEPSTKHIVVSFHGQIIAETQRAYRVLETSHPPVYYIPKEDVNPGFLRNAVGKRTFCEWKGPAVYFDIVVGERSSKAAAWSYPQPAPAFRALRDCLAFYPSRVDECRVDGEVVEAQPGDFYGGWITQDVVGPFKGLPGTLGW